MSKTYNGMRSQTGLPTVFVAEGSETRRLSPQLRLDASQMPSPDFEWSERSLAAYSLSVAMCVDAMNASGDDLRKIISSSPTPFDFMDRVVCRLPFWRWSVDVLDVFEIMKSISRERNIVIAVELAQHRNSKST